jgi:hypothetical protein
MAMKITLSVGVATQQDILKILGSINIAQTVGKDLIGVIAQFK